MKFANLISSNDRGAVTLRLALASALMAASAGIGGLVFTSAAHAETQVAICHANNNDKDPYQYNAPNDSSKVLSGHGAHGGPLWDPTLKPAGIQWGDIIPPIQPDLPNGLNYSGDGDNWLANGCVQPGDAGVDKDGPATARLGSSGNYVLTAVNAGPGTITTQITLVDTVPLGWTPGTPAPAAGSGFSCVTVVQQVTCVTDVDLPPSTVATSPLKVILPVTYTTLGSKTNGVALTSSADTDSGNNSDSVSTTVMVADLTVAKGAPGNVVIGDGDNYVLTVTNSGDFATFGAITVTDTLPAGVTAGAMPTGCSRVDATVTCSSSGILIPTGTLSFTIPVTFTAVGSIVNDASVAGGGEVDTTNNTASATTVVAGIPDMTLSKTAPPNAVVGDGGDYVLTATNDGNGPTSGTITVTDTLPAGVSAGAMPGGCSLATPTVTCTSTGVLAPTNSVSFTIPVTFTTVGSIVNDAAVSGGGESRTNNNDASATTSVTAAPVPDMTLTKTAPANVVVGDSGNYVLTARNSGLVASTSATITVTDNLPAGVTAGTMPAGCSRTGATVTCTSTGVLAPADSVAFTIPVTFTTVGSITNNASVAGGGEANTTNNTASATTAVAGIPDLTLGKTAPANAVVGGTGSYVLTATNAGDGSTSGTITVTDPLPAGVTAGTMPAGCSLGGTTVTCTSTSVLAPAATVSFTIPVTFTAVGSTVNNAFVGGGGETNTANNTASATTAVAGIPDLTLGKTAPATALVGGTGSYVLTATNSGNGPTSGTITVTDPLPAGVTAGTMPAGCTFAAPTVTCTSTGVLAPAATVSFTIPVTFTTAGTVVNNASVSGGGETATGNNGAAASTTVTSPQPPPPGPTNNPPVAVDDSASTAFETPVTINVMSNDSDPDGDPLTIIEAADGENGVVTAAASETAALRLRSSLSAPTTGSLVYTPAAGFSGVDTFTYVISDGRGGTDSALVSVNVAAPAPGPSESPSPSPSPIGGVTDPEPATSPTPSPAASPRESPLPELPFVEEEEPTDTPEALPFTGSSTDQLLGLGALLSLMGLMLIVTGRRRRTVG